METLRNATFVDWFRRKVTAENDFDRFSDIIEGPVTYVFKYKNCIVNGYRFKVDNVKDLTSTNSGVVVLGSCYGDEDEANYYGRLLEVVVFNYPRGKKVVTFRCNWFDSSKGIVVDAYNKIVIVDVKSRLNTDDVFVLASQATQVYYAPNVKDSKSNWHTIVMTKTKAFDGTNLIETDEALQEDVSNPNRVTISDNEFRNVDDHVIPDRLLEDDGRDHEIIEVDDTDSEEEEEESDFESDSESDS